MKLPLLCASGRATAYHGRPGGAVGGIVAEFARLEAA
jgi:hypothetical protein